MLTIYSLQENQKWDDIVRSFRDYDVYYLSGYTKAFYLHQDGDPYLFYYEEDGLRGINVVMKRDISKDPHFKDLEPNKYFDLATPYGYGGWLIEGEGSLEKLMEEYTDWCKENLIICEFVRFHPVLQNQDKMRSLYDVIDLGKTISIDTRKEEEIWNNFDGKNRNVIRKAIKNGVEIKKGLSKELLDTFKEIYNQTMQRDDAEEYYYFEDNFYESILNDLKEEAEVYYAVYNGKIIANSIILKCNGKLSYHLSGSLREYSSLASSNYLLSEVALWGARNGYQSFHLGGGVGSHEDNLYKFKKSFYKGEGLQYSIGKKVFDQDKYQYLVSLRTNIQKEGFFPAYRG